VNLFKASLAYFGLVFGAGFLLAMVRIPVLVPHLGERWAELLEMPLMLAVMIMAARWVPSRFGLRAKPGKCLAMGLVALGLMLAAETGVMLQNQSLAEYMAARDPISGVVYLLMLVVFAVLPRALSGRQFK